MASSTTAQVYTPQQSRGQLDLSIAIPCYNEVSTLGKTVETVVSYMKQHYAQVRYELILINDGSTDGTSDVIIELTHRHEQIRPIFFPYNKGRGAAIKAGLANALGEYLILLDADLSYDVEHIGAIIEQFIEDPRTDVVVVSPYMPGGKVQGVPLFRLILSRMANWILSGSFPIRLHTVTCVVRGYRSSCIKNIPLFEDGKELHLEILRKLCLQGAKMKEIPGRLVWKSTKKDKRRKTNLNFVNSTKDHLLYGLLVRPTRLFKYISVMLLLVGLYEIGTIGYTFLQHLEPTTEPFLKSAWESLRYSYQLSPHTFIIAGVSLILGVQTLFFLTILEVLKLQQEETLRHILAILDPKQLER